MSQADNSGVESQPEGSKPNANLIAALRERVTAALMDSTRNNPLAYFRENRSTRFVVGDLGSPLVDKLLAGQLVRRADFAGFDRQPPSPETPVGTAEPKSGSESGGAEVATPRGPRGWRRPAATPADPLMQRLRATQARAREFMEERGLRTLFAAVGMVSWKATDGGRDPLAPLFLIPLAIEEDKRTRGELVVRRLEDAETVTNRTLLTLGPPALGDALRGLFEGGTVDDIAVGYAAAARIVESIPGLTISPRVAVGIFNFGLMAMIEDLHQADGVLTDHPVIQALAGDTAAQAALAAAREGVVDVTTLDHIPPVSEPFVLDSDPWQTRTIQTLLQYPESHGVISGPPGTGKSQSIANLIGALIAQGLSVLFVAEKRAALDVVKRRLASVGLDHLVIDLHGADVTRQRVYRQLAVTAAKMREATPASDTLDARLIATREELNAHARFMHTPLTNGLAPYQLLSELAQLPAITTRTRLPAGARENVTKETLRQLEAEVREAARSAGLFTGAPDVPWSRSRVASDDIPAAIEQVSGLLHVIDELRTALLRIGVRPASVAELQEAVEQLRVARAALTVFQPAVISVDGAARALALETEASSLGGLQAFFSGKRRRALKAVRAHLRDSTAPRARRLAALRDTQSLTDPWKAAIASIATLDSVIDDAVAALPASLAAAEAAIGAPLRVELDAAVDELVRHSRDQNGAYRSLRMREIREHFVAAHFGGLLTEIAGIQPAYWADAVRSVWLESALDPIRPNLARFDGRTHDDVVADFCRLEADLRKVAQQRVRRVAGERYIAHSREHREQDAAVRVELEKARPRKQLRELFTEAAQAMLGLCPCVMASPLSISQYLPRATIFDIVVFDEGSQVTPESAITAIMRARRVVIAGDEYQLPPTDFFQSAAAEEEDLATDAIAGTESVLTALRPFAKPLDLRVHYRSRDERLIAFSNHHIYADDLVTFPGSGGDLGLQFEYVEPSDSEIDEDSSSPEVERVVDLILDHAERRPRESLGVIAFGLTHARRIDAALYAARRERPDLDEFFSETTEEPCFIKNLERVQGDERDRIILSVGYGRTKTGRVSHSFGPINQSGGERRLNVAITRAKSGLTLVSTIRKVDLDPQALRSRGAQLLAAYLGYAESGGRDLGRDGVDVAVEPNPFEREIQTALEQRLKTSILPQYGVGQFRIDLAVEHPDEPGRFVLAIECDGATYHSTPTARMRDRLRQTVLENLGWRFARIWSTDWFNDRKRELDRVEAIYRETLTNASYQARARGASAPEAPPATSATPAPVRKGPSPMRPPYASINDVSDRQLAELLVWIESDQRLRTDEELFEEMFVQLRFLRRGPRIAERLNAAIRRHRS